MKYYHQSFVDQILDYLFSHIQTYIHNIPYQNYLSLGYYDLKIYFQYI